MLMNMDKDINGEALTDKPMLKVVDNSGVALRTQSF